MGYLIQFVHPSQYTLYILHKVVEWEDRPDLAVNHLVFVELWLLRFVAPLWSGAVEVFCLV